MERTDTARCQRVELDWPVVQPRRSGQKCRALQHRRGPGRGRRMVINAPSSVQCWGIWIGSAVRYTLSSNPDCPHLLDERQLGSEGDRDRPTGLIGIDLHPVICTLGSRADGRGVVENEQPVPRAFGDSTRPLDDYDWWAAHDLPAFDTCPCGPDRPGRQRTDR